ncbi:hypothetical protein SERP1551 [Staphylococcus epidermidis RP62A phage SP-beta]|uniref:Uncharacterized protein n=1 Tax=Staphylococcus epidermidis (strain ATCC 35984 / DSM 28319 / BCRC 17069 / CCUG 31568 / BM 3577 / RP62A) TaxID=176279 RepID=Q5HMS7_STAEQ|nr:hypothetical protein SERP1551 [Staphylococcus epidermidis RP62A]
MICKCYRTIERNKMNKKGNGGLANDYYKKTKKSW